MSIVHIRVGGREYDVACDNGQEDHLRLLVDEVDERLRSLTFGMGAGLSEAMGLLMVSLMMADELIDKKEEIDNLSLEVERLAGEDRGAAADGRMAEIETAMAGTLEEIASRIEKIADQVELR
ncbi:MAG: cell division protein ZapA [Pseudomonadota bacterium]|nr:cell division protein ZapA [Pseudomonadota bacterium]MDE3038251.1 cell division protein ZapA [Pseudomonadota bacterium]